MAARRGWIFNRSTSLGLSRDVLLTGIRRNRVKPTIPSTFPIETRHSLPEQPRFPGSFPTGWTVPYQRNPFFTGREEVLKGLFEALRTDKAVALVQPRALSGLGGIGKTQTAIEYVYRYYSDYPEAILWVRAYSHEVLVADFAAAANALNLPEKDEQDQHRVIDAVKRWLKDHAGWLLVCDNVDNLALIKSFIPSTRRGHILLTTRIQATGEVAQSVAVEKMEPEEGALFLLRRANLIGSDSLLDSASQVNLAHAINISKIMDGLPLALDQAGAYIEETRCSLADYLNIFQKRRKLLLKRRGPLNSDHPESVATTWSLSFEEIERLNPAASELLRFCSFISPDAIPEEIIAEGASELSSILKPIAEDLFELNEAIGVLLRFSFLHRNQEDKVINIHTLVQFVVLDNMSTDLQSIWAGRTIRAVYIACPPLQISQLSRGKRWMPHTVIGAFLIHEWDFTFYEAIQLLNEASFYLGKFYHHQEALSIFEQAIQLNPKSPELQSGKGTTLRMLYRFDESLKAFEQASQLDVDFAPAYVGKGDTLRVLHRYSDAVVAHERAIQLNPNFVAAYIGKGFALRMLLQHTEAIKAFERATALDSSNSNAYAGKGFVLYDLARYEEALEAFEQAIRLDPNNIDGYSGKAGTLYQLKCFNEALISLDQVFRLNPSAIDAYTVKGFVFLSLKYYEEALETFEQVIRQDPYNYGGYRGKANVLYQLKRFDEALTFFEQVLQLNPNAIKGYSAKGLVLYDLARYEEALEAFEQAIQLDPNDIDAYEGKVRVLCAQKCFNEALTIQERVLQLTPNLSQAWNCKGDILEHLNRQTEAQLAYGKAQQLELQREDNL